MDFLSGTLCLSIGCMVAWMLALYTERGVRNLIWDTFVGSFGAAICVWTIAWVVPAAGVIGLVAAGPIFALGTIWAAEPLRRALGRAIGGAF
jgi:hypothetical protein